MAVNWKIEYQRYRHYFGVFGRLYRQKKVRVYTELVLTILAITFFLFFAIRPTLITITGLIREIKDKKLVVKKLEEKINALNEAQEEYFRVQNDLYLVDQSLPSDSQISLLVRQIENLAFSANVTLRSIQYSPVTLKKDKEENQLKALDFQMALNGSYENLKNFLSSLEKFRRIIVLEGLSIKSPKEGMELNLSISGKAFYGKGKNGQRI